MKRFKVWMIALAIAIACVPLAMISARVYAQGGEGAFAFTLVPDKTSASLGDNITYVYCIKNTTSDNISGVSLNDSRFGAIPLTKTKLAPSENITAKYVYKVVLSDFPGPITNTAMATGKKVSGDNVTATASATVSLINLQSSLKITKKADRSSASPHETITYTYTVANTGQVDISNIKLVDNKLGTITMSTTTLAAGATIKAKSIYTVLVSDLPGPIVNTATVEGTNPSGQKITATSNSISVALTIDEDLLTKAEILKMRGVHGKGLDSAPGLQKPFNPKSKAGEHAGKKDKDEGKGKNNDKHRGVNSEDDDGEDDD